MKSIQRMTRVPFAAGLFCLFLIANAALAANPTLNAKTDAAAVEQVLHDACKAYLDANVEKLTEFLTEDFTLTDASGAISTRADDIEIAKKGTIKYEVFENHDMKVRLYGDAAVVTGRTRVKGKAGENAFSSEFQFTDTLVRRDGRWQVAASHISKVGS